MKKINKNTKWWIGTEKEWGFQDKDGDWWLIKDQGENKEQKKMNPCIAPAAITSCGENATKLILKYLVAGLLGVSIVFNVFLYFKTESLRNAITTQEALPLIGLDNGN